mgnify:CR=1 FL=1|jgi:hypothetical protein
MEGNVVWFKSELENQTKWKTENIKQTLPKDILEKLEKVEA